MNLDEALEQASKINGRTSLKALREMNDVLKAVLRSPILDMEAYEQIYNVILDHNIALLMREENIYFDLIEMLAARADDKQLLEIYAKQPISAANKKPLESLRTIWQRIEDFERSWHDNPVRGTKPTARQRWDVVKKLFMAPKSKTGIMTAGKFVHREHWLEIQPDSSGKHLRADIYGELFDVWMKSKADITFQDWIAIVAKPLEHVAYYAPSERVNWQLTIKGGMCFDANRTLVDTSKAESPLEISAKGFVACVLSLDDECYCYGTKIGEQHRKSGEHRHTGIMGGGPVKFAGELAIVRGKIIKITMRSGHYRPTEKELFAFLKFLRVSGIKLDGIKLYGWSRTPIAEDALKWYQDSEDRFLKTTHKGGKR